MLKSRPSTNNMSDNYNEETKPLFKLLRTEAFRFVIVRFNHYSFLQQLEADLHNRFPDRPICKMSAAKASYREIADAYFGLERGFFFLENFEDVLKEERDSLGRETEQMTLNNERRRQITAGLNLRRDKLAQSPITLLVFVPATTGELYAKTIMEKMPDLWSFRSFMLDLEKEISKVITTPTTSLSLDLPNSHLSDPDHTELQRLLARLEKTAETEIPYRLSLYPQIVQQAMDVGKTELAYTMLGVWEEHAYDQDKPTIWIWRGDLLLIHGNTLEALNAFEKAKTLAQALGDKHLIATAYERLGSIHTDLGDLGKALNYFELYAALSKELYDDFPNNVEFKNNLAISYEKLGQTHSSLGDLGKALNFFALRSKLGKELYDDFPNNVNFKNNLAISYFKLGETHSSLGDLKQALHFFELETTLFEELYDAFPNNVSFKNGLAISYAKLGVFYRDQKQNNQARPYFEQAVALWEELVQDAPLVVAYQRFLATARQDLAALGAV